jgi:hypothetical protein
LERISRVLGKYRPQQAARAAVVGEDQNGTGSGGEGKTGSRRLGTEGIRSNAEITELGKRYAETHDSEIQLEICRAFHPYLMKYLVMICRGHVPVVGVGGNPNWVNREVKKFILFFMPKGAKITRRSMIPVVRQFHLAFKGHGDGRDL